MIFQRVSAEFQVTELRKKYYCAGLNYFALQEKLKNQHGEGCSILVRFDHIVVKTEQEIFVYL